MYVQLDDKINHVCYVCGHSNDLFCVVLFLFLIFLSKCNKIFKLIYGVKDTYSLTERSAEIIIVIE